MDDSDFICTPQEAGEQMTQRKLSAFPLIGTIKPFTQIPLTFICKTKLPKREKGNRNHVLENQFSNEKEMSTKKKNDLLQAKSYFSTAAIKFDDLDKNAKNHDNKIANPISIFMTVSAILPYITLDKTMVNFWDCKLKERKFVEIKISNKNEDLPIDFVFNKV